jgi:hypothetical protein
MEELTMSASNSPIWPAIFSAISAIVLLIIHFRNRIDSVRQEIILDDWAFGIEPNGNGNIQVKKIINVGKGSALQLSGWLELQGAKPGSEGGSFFGCFVNQYKYYLLEKN